MDGPPPGGSKNVLGSRSDNRREGPASGVATGQATRADRIVWVALGGVVVAVIVAGLWSLVSSRHDGSLPVMGAVPDFRLVERSGRAVTRADLAGRVWVANFIFTSCSGVCPVLSARMAELRQKLGNVAPDVRSVSMSVDPTRDTPAVLREYAGRYGAGDGWLFLTGDRKALHELIRDGFHLSVAERSPEEGVDPGELITHSDRFVLVDRRSRIRGYYRGTEPDALVDLFRDAQALAAGG